MPDLDENLKMWNEAFDWEAEDWSRTWGSSAAMWYGFVLPRVWRFLPATTILEIAPGFGRWTQFLLEHCDTLIGVDLAPKCIEACRQRFADRPGATFETNDGQSLPMVADSSIDLAFSLDSLVHVEAEPLSGYVTELARVLKPDGVAFIHHSNDGVHRRSTRALAPLQGAFRHSPASVQTALEQVGARRGHHWRGQSVTATRFAELCERAGMRCVGQELVNWGGGVLLIDCISVVTHPGSRWDRPNQVVKNRWVLTDARATRRSGRVYGASPLAPA